MVTAPVLIPYTPDCEYQYGEEVLPPEKIKLLADTFNKYQIIDLQHEYTKRLINKQEPIERGKLINSYITTDKLYLKGLDGYTRKYPKGSWIITVKITDKTAMKLYNAGEITGFSVTVKERDHANAILDYVKKHKKIKKDTEAEIHESEKAFTKKPKRILMKDVKDPVAFTVSLVRQPCVYGAKFCQKSCLITNKNKLKENTKSNMSLKERIKSEINTLIDGIDVEEESVKEEIDTESQKEDNDGQTNTGGTTTIGGSGGSMVDEGDIDDEDNNGTSTDNLDNAAEQVEQAAEPDEEDNGTSQGKTKKEDITNNESQKDQPLPPKGVQNTNEEEDETEESEKCSAKKCKKTKKECRKESNTEKESDKSVLYLAQEDVEELIKTTLQRYAEEVEQMVFDGIQDALDEYEYSGSFKENPKEDPDATTAEVITEPEEEEEEEEEVKYATKEMVEEMFDEQFASFKSDLLGSIKKAQKESIKSYSKAISPESDGLKNEPKKAMGRPMGTRDVYGRKIRKN